MLKELALILISIIPVALLLKFTFDKDTIEKEPATLLFRIFISGILSAVIVLLLSKALRTIIKLDNDLYRSFIEIGFIEEICKWIFIYIITWNNKEFNYKFDAIVYCIFASLGFAFVENICYSFNYGIITALLRSIISVPGHAFFAVYMGYYLGMAKKYYMINDKKRGSLFTIYSVIIPTLLHGIYNFCLMGQNDFIYMLFITFIIALYILSFKTINSSSNTDSPLQN